MKTDVRGRSTCREGEEKWERFQLRVKGRMQRFVQYEYRDLKGNLFTCVKPTLRECRIARDRHLKLENIQP